MAEHIERGLALERINDLRCEREFDSKEEERGWNNAIDVALSEVRRIPIADVRPERRGRWIKEGNGVIVCSECGEEHEWEYYRASYCEDCGAKMIDGEDGYRNDS